LFALPLLWLGWRRARVALAFAPAPLLDQDLARGVAGTLPRTLAQRLAALPRLLQAGAVGLAVVALARPVQRVPLPPERLGIDVLLCVDTSSSMAAEDLAPGRSRHDVALELGAEFVQQRAFDRVGFVTFARYPDLRCPPTLDHEAAAELLRGTNLVVKESPEDATGIGTAVARAAEVLARSKAKGKVIVLLTDGEENVATTETPDEIAPLHAAQLCAALSVRVHGIVVGRGNQKPDGRFVALDTTAVQQLAAQTGGKFFAARDAAALQQVYRDIDAIERVAFAEPRTLVVEWFAAPLLGALLLLAVAWSLARRWLEVSP
jgi:Ca-activated chloride channel family protein